MAFLKQLGSARLAQEAEGAGGRLIYFQRSDFFSINLDDDATAILEIALRIIHHAYLGAYLFAGESRGGRCLQYSALRHA